MATVTQQQLIDAGTDADTFAHVVNDGISPGTVTSRLGQTYRTVAKAIQDLGSASGYASINSPIFTGIPQAPTLQNPAIGANIATTDYVNNHGMQFGGYSVVDADRSLDKSELGRIIKFNSYHTVSLPYAGIPPQYTTDNFQGATATFFGGPTGGVIGLPSGVVLYNKLTVSVPYYLVGPMETVQLALVGTNVWIICGGVIDKSWYGCLVYRSIAQSIPAVSATTILYNGQDWNPLGSYNPSNGVFTYPMDGTYLVGARYFGTASQSTFLSLQINVNNAYNNTIAAWPTGLIAPNSTSLQGSCIIQANKNETTRVIVTIGTADTTSTIQARENAFWVKAI